MTISLNDKMRFLKKIHPSSSEGCWEWIGAIAGKYGSFYFNGKQMKAHRFSYMLHAGEIPAGKVVMHRCDNPKCVNPEHLSCGTQSENLNDCVLRGRHWSITNPEKAARGERHNSVTKPQSVPRGESSGMSKLTEQKVKEIRALIDRGENYETTAVRFNVSPTTISKIHKRISWRHV